MRIMLDTETLATTAPVILSLGLVAFDTRIENEYYAVVDPASYGTPPATIGPGGFRVDVSTVAWWALQSEEAREEIFGTGSRTSLHRVLEDVYLFVTDFAKEHDIEIWSKGAGADIVWLERAFETMGLSCPWHYTQTRCFRTLEALARDLGLDSEAQKIAKTCLEAKEDSSVAHNALADAWYQAEYAMCVLGRLEEK